MKKYLIIALILLISSTTLAFEWFYEDPMRSLYNFSECWLSEYMECDFWDFNNDDIVNFIDLNLLLLKTAPALPSPGGPEPTPKGTL